MQQHIVHGYSMCDDVVLIESEYRVWTTGLCSCSLLLYL